MDEHWDDSEESDTIDLDSVLSSVSTVFGFVCWCLGILTLSIITGDVEFFPRVVVVAFVFRGRFVIGFSTFLRLFHCH